MIGRMRRLCLTALLLAALSPAGMQPRLLCQDKPRVVPQEAARTTELRKYRDQARALAIQAAKEKAVALAGELDQQVGAPTHIQEVHSSWYSGYSSWWGSRLGNAMTQNVIQEVSGGDWTGDGSMSPGQIQITSRVSVSFELVR